MFKLNFDIPLSKDKISLSDSICLMGSCFSDAMAEMMSANKLNNLSNPFGTIYNPHSIFNLLSAQTAPNRMVESQGVHYHWDSHGSVSGLTAEETEATFEQTLNQLQSFLKSANWLVITLGTAFVYEHESAGIVANCHKVPSAQFNKRLLSQNEIIEQFGTLQSHLQQINPAIKVVLTVSPVRHIRDGLIENNRSKSILLDAVHQINDRHDHVTYFPSYEILMDELRDYRFFDSDMVHPSKAAIEYIWEKFSETYFDQDTQQTLAEWTKIKAALDHKPFQPQSAEHQKFLKNTLSKLQKMNEKMDVHVELEHLKKQIK